MGKILIVVDMQNDFITGSLGTLEAKSIVPLVKKKVEEYRAKHQYVYFTQDTHEFNYFDTPEGKKLPVEHCIRSTNGWEIHKDLTDKSYVASGTILKPTFGYSAWSDFFRRIVPFWTLDEIEIVGVCTDICVITNALLIKTELPGTKIVVDASCCAGTTPEKHKMALEIMKSCQIDVIGE